MSGIRSGGGGQLALLQRVRALENARPSAWWTDIASFALVAGQTDYLFAPGTVDTDASHALVQWGAIVLVPNIDYTVLFDRLHLIASPSAEQAASGEPLVIRFRRL